MTVFSILGSPPVRPAAISNASEDSRQAERNLAPFTEFPSRAKSSGAIRLLPGCRYKSSQKGTNAVKKEEGY
jgi:hypothetical protein